MASMTPRERIMTALRRGIPDRIPCFPDNVRWVRYHSGCTCPRHQLAHAEEFGFDCIINYAQYIWQPISNDYCYAPGGGFSHTVNGFYGDLPEVQVDIQIENTPEQVWYRRTFRTPAGTLHDVIQWARPNCGYGDGPNPHRVEPLVKSRDDLAALRYLYAPPRRDLLADIPLVLAEVGDRAVVAAYDCTHAGGWGLDVLDVEDRLIFSIEQPELLRDACGIMQESHLRNLRAMLDRGCRVVFDSWFQCGLSVGWSPRTFTDIFLPLIAGTAALAHEYGAVYICYDAGRMMHTIPLLIEAGVDVIAGLQPPDMGDVVLREVKTKYGDRVSLMGGLDPVYLLQWGTPETIREAVRQAITDAGPGGGFILHTAMSPAPETPAESLRVAVQAVRDFGVYRSS